MENQIIKIKSFGMEFVKTYEDHDAFYKLSNFKTQDESKKVLEKIKKTREQAKYDFKARENVLFHYSQALLSNQNFVKVDDYIDFEKITHNEVSIIFEMLLLIYDLKDLIYKFNLDYEIVESDIIQLANQLSEDIKTYFIKSEVRVAFFAQLIYMYTNGDGPIDTLRYHNINDLAFIRQDYIYVVVDESCYHLKFLKFINYHDMVNVAYKNTMNAFSQSNPAVVTEKPNGSRITVTGFEHAPINSIYYNERVFNNRIFSLSELVGKSTLSKEMAEILSYIVKGRGRIIVTGSNSNVGKTTMMIALMNEIDRRDGLGLLDNNDETKLATRIGNLNVITNLVRDDEKTDIIFNFFYKQSRRFLSIGELVTPSQAAMLISLSLSMNSGIITNTFSIEPTLVIENLSNKMIEHPKYNSKEQAINDLIQAVDIVVHLKRSAQDSSRIICTGIYEVIKKPTMLANHSMKLDELEKLDLLKKHTTDYKYVELVRYDEVKDEWIFSSKPSNQLINRLDSVCRDKYKIDLNSYWSN